MTKKNKDFDIDTSGISGTNEVSKPGTEFCAKEDGDWKEVLERLKKASGKECICLPIITEDKLYLVIRDLHDATGEEFLKWLNLVYPPSCEAGFTAKECEEYKYREATYRNLLELFKFPLFPKNKQSLPNF